MNWLNVAEWFRKIPTAFLVAVISALGLVLFLPDRVAEAMAVLEFRVLYKAYLGPIFLLAVSFCIAKMYLSAIKAYKNRKMLEDRQQMLHSLTPEEKGYLVPFIQNQQNTIKVGVDDGIAGGLVGKGILYRSSNLFNMIEGVPYNLQPWVKEYLESRPDLLQGAVGRPMSPHERGSWW